MKLLLKLVAAALAVAATCAAAENAVDATETAPAIAAYGFQETGETRLCLTYTKLDGVAQIAIGEFLFLTNGEHYLNKTQSRCPYRQGRQPDIYFVMKTGRICKNTSMYVDGRVCRLSYFRKLAPIVEEEGLQ